MVVVVSLLLAPTAALAQDDVLENGQALLDEGEYEQAVEAFTEVLDDNPDNVDALVGRSRAYGQLGDPQQALVDAKRAVALAPESGEAYMARGLALLAAGSTEDGIADMEQAAALDPDNAEIFFTQAEVYIVLGEIDRALVNYDKAIDLDPRNDEYLYRRGNLYYALSELESALKDYNAAIKLDPGNADYYFSRSYVHFDMDNLEAALEDDNRVIEMEPDYASGYLNRGFHYYSNEAYEQASADYYQWITLNETERIEEDPIEKADRRELEMDEGWLYVIPFSAPGAGTLTVEVISPGGLVDPVVVILDDEGVPFMVDDDGGMGLSVLIENYMLPYQGDFTLVVSHAGGGSVGEVVVDVEIGRNFGNA